MMWRAPMMTQSVGVPFTAKWRSPTSRSRSGSLSDSECDTPDWSVSGATIQTSSDSSRAISSQSVEARRVDAVVIGDEDAHDSLPWRRSIAWRMVSANHRPASLRLFALALAFPIFDAAHIGRSASGTAIAPSSC